MTVERVSVLRDVRMNLDRMVTTKLWMPAYPLLIRTMLVAKMSEGRSIEVSCRRPYLFERLPGHGGRRCCFVSPPYTESSPPTAVPRPPRLAADSVQRAGTRQQQLLEARRPVRASWAFGRTRARHRSWRYFLVTRASPGEAGLTIRLKGPVGPWRDHGDCRLHPAFYPPVLGQGGHTALLSGGVLDHLHPPQG